MTDNQTRVLQEHVEEFLRSKPGWGLDIGNPSHFQLLVDQVRPDFGEIAEDELRTVVALCWLGPQMAGIPPTPIRNELLNILRRFVPGEQERLERIMEFSIAYGCGKWREPKIGYGGWEQRWQGAMRGLVRALEPATSQANRWLAEHVVGFPQNRSASYDEACSEDTAVWSDAWMLATRLIRPEHLLPCEQEEVLSIECVHETEESVVTEFIAAAQGYQRTVPPGTKAVWTVQEKDGTLALFDGQEFSLPVGVLAILIAREEDAIIKTAFAGDSQQVRLKPGEDVHIKGATALAMWECTCGTTHCKGRHRLDSWDPTQSVPKVVIADEQRKTEEKPLTLWDFVASAVKGPQARIKTGSFVQGIYFPLLAQEGCEP